MADQRLITVYSGDASPKDIIVRDLPVADVPAGTTIYLHAGDAVAKDIILRDPALVITSGLATAAPLTGLVTFIGYAPTASGQAPVEATVTPAAAVLTVNGLGATQQTFATLLPGTATVGFAGNSPAALAENQIGATTGLVSLVGYAPSIVTESIVIPSVGAVAFLGAIPAVVTSEVTEATVTPDTAILGASGSIPWIELEATGKSAKYRNRRTKYWWDEPSKAQVDPDVTPELPPDPPPLNVVAIPDSGMGVELNRINQEIAATSAKLEAYRRKRARRREEEAIIALLAA